MKALGFVCLAALLPAVGCGVDAGELEQDPAQVQEQVGTKEQGLMHRLTATDANVDILRFGCYDDSSTPRLKWNCSDSTNNKDGSHLVTGCQRQVGTNDTEIGTNLGYCYWGGQCVDFVKGMTHDTRQTAYWNKGDNVVASGSANPGDAVATFDSAGNYNSGHTGIFMSYLKDSAGHIVGFRMADQNWGVQAITKHEFRKGYSGHADADIYYFIRVND